VRRNYVRQDPPWQGLRVCPVCPTSRRRDGHQPDARLPHWKLTRPSELGSQPEQLWSGRDSLPSCTASASLPIDGHATVPPLWQLRSNEV
ncbi:hypothetical protein LTR60_004143, partial [Cryomyces antarcticus]